MQYQFSELKEKLQKLPSNIQEAISSVSVGRAMEEIGKKHRLHIDQMNELFDETGLVMLGISHPKDYIRNLQNRLSINADSAKKIAVDVNEQIFRPIRESLKQIHSISEADAESRVKSQELRNEGGKVQTETPQKKIQDTRYKIQDTKMEDHPILRLRKTSQEAATLLSKKETADEKSATRGNVIGWPIKQEVRSKNYELREKKPLQANEADKIQPENKPFNSAQGKPFLKITPEKRTQEARSKKQETNTFWKPEQPEKEAPAPRNLPTAGVKEEVPPLASYPEPESRIKNNELGKKEADNKQQTIGGEQPAKLNAEPSTLNATPVVPKDSVSEKLSGSFRLPRTETEHREERIDEATKKRGYAESDPYREPID